MTARLSLAPAMLLAGCAGVAPVADPNADVPVHGSTGRTCKAAAAQGLVGRGATSELGSEALRLTGAGILRWLRPGDIVTMEYRQDRLNIELDAASRVKALRCG